MLPCANAWTCVVLIRMQPRPMMPFTTIVATSAPMATGGSVAASLGPPGRSFVTDSWRICRKETIMMMEKTRIPRGSSRRRPTGNLCRSRRMFHWTSLFVVQMMRVQSRSRAESTSEAMREREEDAKAAMTLAMRRMTLAMTLICGCLVGKNHETLE